MKLFQCLHCEEIIELNVDDIRQGTDEEIYCPECGGNLISYDD